MTNRVVLVIACLLLAPGIRADDASTLRALEFTFGESEPYREFFLTLKAALSNDDREQVARMMSYPLRVSGQSLDGSSGSVDASILNCRELLLKYDDIFTTNVLEAVSAQTFSELGIHSDGVKLGRGQIWFTGVCDSEECETVTVGVISVNTDAPW